MEPILIGAALGAGTSAAMGGDPLKGALMGGVTGGVGAGLGGGLSSVGATAQAGANTTAQAGALGLPSTVGASLAENATGVMGDVLEQAALSGASYSSNPFIAGTQHLMSNPSTTLGAITGGMPGGDMAKQFAMQNIGGLTGGGQQQQQQIQARPISQGQYQPAQSLLEERQMMPPRRRISLL
jgi:hypothetical protein